MTERQDSIQVSVVMPFFNTPERFLREAVASVSRQKSVNFELLLVDDGSDEAFGRVARDLAENTNGLVRYLSHGRGINKGISASRNLGVTEALGEYLAFLDSDDVWLPDKLSEQLEVFQNYPQADLVFGLSEYWYDWSGIELPVSEAVVPDRGVQEPRLFSPPEFLTNFLRGKVIVPSASNFMVRKGAFWACDGFEESFPGMYEDQAFYAKLGLEHVVCVVPRRWDKYRQHRNSLTAKAGQAESERTARRRFLIWLREYCRERGMYGPDLSEAISKELWLCQSGDRRNASPGRRWVRWGKKWYLRVEEAILPEKIRQLWWCRQKDDRGPGPASPRR